MMAMKKFTVLVGCEGNCSSPDDTMPDEEYNLNGNCPNCGEVFFVKARSRTSASFEIYRMVLKNPKKYGENATVCAVFPSWIKELRGFKSIWSGR